MSNPAADRNKEINRRAQLLDLAKDTYFEQITRTSDHFSKLLKDHWQKVSKDFLSGYETDLYSSDFNICRYLPSLSSQLLVNCPEGHTDAILSLLAELNHPLTLFFNQLKDYSEPKYDEKYILDLTVLRIGQKVFWPGLVQSGKCRLLYSENDFDGDALWIESSSIDFSEGQRFLPLRGERYLPFVIQRRWDLFGRTGIDQGHSESDKWWNVLTEYSFDFALEVAGWFVEEIEEEFREGLDVKQLSLVVVASILESDRRGGDSNNKLFDFVPGFERLLTQAVRERHSDNSGRGNFDLVEITTASIEHLIWENHSEDRQLKIIRYLMQGLASQNLDVVLTSRHFLRCAAVHPSTKQKALDLVL